MLYIAEEIFEVTGRNLHDYVELYDLDSMYELIFHEYIERTEKKLKVLAPVVQSPMNRFTDMLKPHVLKAVGELEIRKSHFCIYRMISVQK